MTRGTEKIDHTLLIFLFAVFTLNSPFTTWWSRMNLPWYSLFVIWGLIILLVAINQLRIGTRGD